MSDRPPMMQVEAMTIARDENSIKAEVMVSSLSVRKVDCFVTPSSKSPEPACKATFPVRFQWLNGGGITSAVLFDRSLWQLGPSTIPVYKRVRHGADHT